MPIHISNGRLLLKNFSNDSWYYIFATVDDDDSLPHIEVSQTVAGDFSLSDYDEYVILRCADDGQLYRLDLYTNGDGKIDYRFELAVLPVSKRPSRIFVKDQVTLLLYEIKATQDVNTGLVHPQVVAYSTTGNTTIDKPFRCHTPATVTENSCISPANFFTKATVIIPPANNAPVLPIIIGEGGEAVIGEGGDPEFIEGES